MCNGDLTLAIDPPMRSIAPFDISDLECEALLKLFREATSHIRDIRIEMVTDGKRHPEQEAHPATTLGLAVQKPTIRFARSLDREQRIDAIAHELVHILLVYRYGLRMIDRRTPRLISNQDIFDYFLNLNRHWKYFLEQIVNTIHHRILIDYLRGSTELRAISRWPCFSITSASCLRAITRIRNPNTQKGLLPLSMKKGWEG